jgi:hypothetical protein
MIGIYNKYRKRKKGSENMEEAKEAKRQYMKEWRSKNKDKVKAAQERYWTKKYKEMKIEN